MTDYAFTFNGLTFGGAGAAVQIRGVQGLEDMPDLRTSDEARGFVDGMFYGRDLLGGRTVTIDLQIATTGTLAAYRATLELLKAALVPSATTTLPLQFTLPGLGVRRINARCRRRSLPIDLAYQSGLAKGAVEFYAGDPRIYDDVSTSVAIGLPSASGGRTYNRTYNVTYGAVSSGNVQVCTNAGTIATKPVITLTGPVDTPFIQNVTSGAFLKFNLTLAAGETLTIDTDSRSVVLNGTASRRSALSIDSTWFDLAPGANTLLYSAAAFTASIATVNWRSAYL